MNLEYQTFGHSIYGPFLFAYVHWMRQQLREKGISRVFCLSRDGYMMKKGLEALDAEDELQIRYLYCSRKSLRQALLWNYESY